MSEQYSEPTLVEITATCHTADCENVGIAIAVQWPEGVDPYVICGPCGQRIADVT